MSDAIVKKLTTKRKPSTPWMGDGSVLTNYQPTFRESVTDKLRKLMFSDDREGQRKAERLSNVMETVTPYGVATGVDDAAGAFRQGDMATGGLMLGMAGLPGPSPKPKPQWMEEILSAPRTRKAQAADLAKGGKPLKMTHADGRSAMVGPDMSSPGSYRFTRFDSAGPVGHTEHQTLEEAIDEALRERYSVMATPPASNGIRAFHGSPHSFDKFSMDKIGTGEGAQAYGHGLYFADSENIAKHYREALAGAPTTQFKGNDYALSAIQDELIGFEKANPPKDYAERSLRKNTMLDAAKVILDSAGDGRVATGLLENLVDSFPSAARPTVREWIAQTENMVKPHIAVNTPGYMYEVNINADPESFLDWDAPLSAQSQTIQDAFKDIPQAPDIPGQLAVYRLGDRKLNNPEATKKMRDAGIPGIKYLDAGSRAKGDGSRNYVVFDDKLISIVRKYGIAGASAMLGYNILDGVDEAQAKQLKQMEQAGKVLSGW